MIWVLFQCGLPVVSNTLGPEEYSCAVAQCSAGLDPLSLVRVLLPERILQAQIKHNTTITIHQGNGSFFSDSSLGIFSANSSSVESLAS